MTALEPLVSHALEWLGRTAVDVVLLIAVVAVISRLLRRWLTPRWTYALWLLVPLRLVLPALPASPVSLNRLGLGETAAVTAPAEPAPDLDAFTLSEGLKRSAPSAAPASATPRPVAAASSLSAPRPEPAPAPEEPFPWTSALVLTWAAGAAAFLTVQIVRDCRFARRTASDQAVSDPVVLARFERCREAAGVRHAVALLVSAHVGAPAVHGVLRPRVLLPRGVLEGLADEELDAVFRHELAHVRCHDAAANWVLCVIHAVHWFHPAVWFALGRLRAHRECARDWMALARVPATAHTYANTLIRLLEIAPARRMAAAPALFENVRDLRRRIQMATRYRPASRMGIVLGALLLGVVAVVTLTSAPGNSVLGQEPAEGVDRAAKSAPALLRIKVERQKPEPAWKRELVRKLAEEIDMDLADAPLQDFVAAFREATHVNVIVAPDVLLSDEYALSVSARGAPAESVLRRVLRRHDLDHALTGEAVLIGRRGETPHARDRRFYNVRPLTSRGADEDEAMELGEQLVALVMTLVSQESWSENGVQIGLLGDLLVVDNRPRVHDGVEATLNLLLNRGRTPPRTTPAWETKLNERLSQTLSLDFQESEVSSIVEYIALTTDTSVVLSDDVDAESLVSLTLNDVTARQALNWVAHLTGLRVVPADGAVHLTAHAPLVFRSYGLEALLGDGAQDEDHVASMFDLLRQSVDPVSWEEREHLYLDVWDDQVVVAQTAEAHAGIVEFFAALRRAMDD